MPDSILVYTQRLVKVLIEPELEENQRDLPNQYLSSRSATEDKKKRKWILFFDEPLRDDFDLPLLADLYLTCDGKSLVHYERTRAGRPQTNVGVG